MANSDNAHEDGRDDDLHPPDPGHTSKNDRPATPAPPSPLALVRTSPVKQGFRVGAAKKKQAPAAAARVVKPSTAANKKRRPPLSPTSTAAATLKGCNQNLRRSLGLKKMSSANGTDSGSQPQSPLSQGSHVQSQSQPSPVLGSPQPESEPIPIDIDDDTDEIDMDEEEGVVVTGSKRKLTSDVWKEFTRLEVGGTVQAKCNY
ncbi:unnamed protein product [Urochloa humidicola]